MLQWTREYTHIDLIFFVYMPGSGTAELHGSAICMFPDNDN